MEFQFTPLREGRRRQQRHHRIESLFQFTPLREGRPELREDSSLPTLFQFTPLREGRRTSKTGLPVSFVSIHAPA